MAGWIFQANPRRFDINRYLADGHTYIWWSLNQHRNEVHIGDEVFLWRSNNERGIGSGIIARTMVVSELHEEVPVDEWIASDYWHEEAEGNGNAPCVKLELLELKLTEGQYISRAACLENEVLQGLGIIKMAQRTNYVLHGEELNEVRRLWK